MSGFNFLDASVKGYREAWEHREAIARHAVTPLLVKLGALAAVLFLGLEQNYLRQGLVMLPAFFAEGFLVAYILRIVLTGQDLRGDIRALDTETLRDLIASMIVYVLIKLMLSFVVGMTFANMEQQSVTIQQVGVEGGEQIPGPSVAIFLGSLFMLGFMIWAFRFLWLYIPAALGQRLDVFWEKISGFNVSFYMMACWLLCFVPFGLVMMLYMQFVFGLFPVPEGQGPGQSARLLIVAGQGVIELAMVIVSSLAMAYGFREIAQKASANTEKED